MGGTCVGGLRSAQLYYRIIYYLLRSHWSERTVGWRRWQLSIEDVNEICALRGRGRFAASIVGDWMSSMGISVSVYFLFARLLELKCTGSSSSECRAERQAK